MTYDKRIHAAMSIDAEVKVKSIHINVSGLKHVS